MCRMICTSISGCPKIDRSAVLGMQFPCFQFSSLQKSPDPPPPPFLLNEKPAGPRSPFFGFATSLGCHNSWKKCQRPEQQKPQRQNATNEKTGQGTRGRGCELAGCVGHWGPNLLKRRDGRLRGGPPGVDLAGPNTVLTLCEARHLALSRGPPPPPPPTPPPPRPPHSQ